MTADLPRLELLEISKSFGATRALERVSFTVQPGEVHVLAGENGAGKSTLIRIIAGALADYEGELRLAGKAVRFRSPAAALAAGIATIHQELSLVPTLSIADNLALSRRGSPLAPHSRREAHERAHTALARLGLALDPATLLEALSVAERQLVEVARALAGNVRVLVMDEPTSALAEPDALRLMSLIERLKRDGIGILYISHRLNEIFRLADRVTVLRDGQRVFTRPAEGLGRDELVNAMVGSAERAPAPALGVAATRTRLSARALATPPPKALHPVDFDLGVGELVGVAGVEGSGVSSLFSALFGDAPGVTGTVTLDGEPYLPQGPRAALERGVALLASSRTDSVLALLDVTENATLASLPAHSPRGFLQRAEEERVVAPETARVRLKASLRALAGTLSGGNQQKVALVRCLLTRPRLLLLDDPTRGIDVRARADVHEVLRTLALSGTTVLFRSSDLAELCTLAHRVLVVVDGRLVSALERNELDEARVLGLMMGGAA